MKKLTFFLFIVFFSQLFPQNQYSIYYNNYNFFGYTSPGAMKYGLYGRDNPALLSYVENLDMQFSWSDYNGNWNDFNHWGLFAALPNLGFNAVRENFGNRRVTDYQLSSAMGNRTFSLGFGYNWSTGDRAFFNRSRTYSIGALLRPFPFLSAGVVGYFPSGYNNEAVLDIAVRPFADEKLSLFADYVFKKDLPSSATNFSFGAAVEAYPGIRITGRYFENKAVTAGLEIAFGNIALGSRTHFQENGNHLGNIYNIRVGGYDRNPFAPIFNKGSYIGFNMQGDLRYRRFRFFDNSKTLIEILSQIKAAKEDNTVSGIVIITSGMSINREMLWEMRKELQQFKDAGKKIVILIDRIGIDGYHLASVADKIVMDPEGMLTLEGYMLGRQFYRGTLEKLGIGFTEWRYFTYKSALESFSRDSMSIADREQRAALIDDFYSLAVADIAKGRNLPQSRIDSIINNHPIFLPEEALQMGLVDSIGRWESITALIKNLEGTERNVREPKTLEKFHLPEDNYWGEKPEIAVIYALGVCAMDQGINARKLHSVVEAAGNNKNIKAIVFRVDSPGGDGLASDLVAEKLREAAKKKPVIISQGAVAASGGYWLSMYGDKIFAAPNTVTGSIGVIGGWYYNKDLKESLGITTDYIKKGDHADLGFGMTLPLIGLTLPDRDLTPKEQEFADRIIKTSYRDFVRKVATGRNMTYDQVDSVGQGRVWTGMDGLNNGLVDMLGNLNDAIAYASEQAGLKGKEYKIVEMPDAPVFDFSTIMPSFFGIKLHETNKYIDDLKFRLQYNGKPLPLLPIDYYEAY
jgi:protease IV